VDVKVSDEPQKTYRAMMNIGYRPTVDGSKKMIEVNIFDFDRMIYGKYLQVFVKKFLRAEEKFNGLDALKELVVKLV
jgi:riboflavin kinase/FMN adenylyltransferase